MQTYTALPLSKFYDSVHRVDLERELDDRDPSGKVGDVTFEDTSHKHTYVLLYVCILVYTYVCIRER